jgi:RecA/RadA recombinase
VVNYLTKYYYHHTQDIQSCPTGWTSLDQVFGGRGLPTHAVIQVLGMCGSGKTQVALSTAVACACSGKRVLFIDTGNGFNHSRVDQMMNMMLKR